MQGERVASTTHTTMAISTSRPDSVNDELFSSEEAEHSLPKKHFPLHERDPRTIYQAVHDELLADRPRRTDR